MTDSVPRARGGPADVVLVLVLIEVAAGLLAMVGQLLVVPSPVYVPLPLATAVGLVVLAVKVAAGRRWALIAMLAAQAAGLSGVWLGLVASFTPTLAGNVTLTGLLTAVAAPVAVIWLCGRMLAGVPPHPASRHAPVGPAAAPPARPSAVTEVPR